MFITLRYTIKRSPLFQRKKSKKMASRFYDYQAAIVAERFHSIDHIGCGPHGNVYRAYDKKMDSIVVVKRLEMASIVQEETLKREITDLKKIRHVRLAAKQLSSFSPARTLLTIDSATLYPSTTHSSAREWSCSSRPSENTTSRPSSPCPTT